MNHDDTNYFSNFSIYTKKEISQQSQINELISLAQKYGMAEIENKFVSSVNKSFLFLINYISTQKSKNGIPQDLSEAFLNNIFLKEQTNQFLHKKIYSLLHDDSSEFSKNITILDSILTIGSNEKIFDLENNLDFNSISNLFRFYEKRLNELIKFDFELFNQTFNTYIVLLKMFIQLCAINAIDFKKIDEINEIIDLITESINLLKFTTPLDNKKLSKINNLQGKCLYYFSHLEIIPINIESIELDIEKYLLVFEKQEDGFMLSKKNQFGYEASSYADDEFLIFKKYSSILLLNLLKKLETFDDNLYLNNNYLKKIVKSYNQNFSFDYSSDDNYNLKDFKESLILSLLNKYHSNLNHQKRVDYHFIIEDFIFSGNEFNNKNLETIYRILTFTDDIENFKLLQIVQMLVNSKQIQNNYYEYFKLKIFEIFINQTNEITNLLLSVNFYLQKNNFDFNLKSIVKTLLDKLEEFKIDNQIQENKKNSPTNEFNNKTIIKYDFLDDDYDLDY